MESTGEEWVGRDKRGLFEYRGRYTPGRLEPWQGDSRCEWVVVAWKVAGGHCEGICGARTSCLREFTSVLLGRIRGEVVLH